MEGVEEEKDVEVKGNSTLLLCSRAWSSMKLTFRAPEKLAGMVDFGEGQEGWTHEAG